MWPFGKTKPEILAADQLVEHVVAASRQPDIYAHELAMDDFPGRLDMLWIFASIMIWTLRHGTAPDEILAQTFVDRLFKNVDQALRDMGVGDMSIARKARRHASEFLGRSKSYCQAFDHQDDAALQEALARNLYRAADLSQSPIDTRQKVMILSQYVWECLAALNELDAAARLQSEPIFPSIHAKPASFAAQSGANSA